MQKKSSFFALLISAILLNACQKTIETPVDYRSEMRQFIREISERGRLTRPGFMVIPQNGQDLLTTDGTPQGTLETSFRLAIDGFGREELFYGYDNNDDLPAAEIEQTHWLGMCDFAVSQGLQVLTTDYVYTRSKVDDAYVQNAARGFLAFAADHRELDNIPAYPALPPNVNNDTIVTLADARNFLYVISPSAWETKEAFIQAMASSTHDILIIDLFYDEEMLTAADLQRIKQKPNGGTRLVICYMSIGQGESYRWYWSEPMQVNPPSWFVAEDPYWTDNFYVKYWDSQWKQIILGQQDSYMSRILNAGFDGVYLDIVTAYEYFEEAQ
ncbi:MAG: endo alpha-1,4 polygalactosaminidase [Bacteroidia bacterium]